jgi:DNA-binding CsgD family transcriptional regulator
MVNVRAGLQCKASTHASLDRGGGSATWGQLMHAHNTAAEDVVALAEVIDSLSLGVFVIGEGGAIVHANAQARVILASNDVLCAVSGRLMATDPRSSPVLRDAIIAATLGDAGGALPLTSRGGVRHVIQVLPLRASGRCAAVVFVARATFETSSCPDLIRRAYRLTPTELRVLFAIVEFGGVPEVATALGIANSTVRTHVGHLFSKTGTSRQADLVKIVAAFSHRVVA